VIDELLAPFALISLFAAFSMAIPNHEISATVAARAALPYQHSMYTARKLYRRSIPSPDLCRKAAPLESRPALEGGEALSTINPSRPPAKGIDTQGLDPIHDTPTELATPWILSASTLAMRGRSPDGMFVQIQSETTE
jgi:hypothetical protein